MMFKIANGTSSIQMFATKLFFDLLAVLFSFPPIGWRRWGELSIYYRATTEISKNLQTHILEIRTLGEA
jgi:hypothetical protein